MNDFVPQNGLSPDASRRFIQTQIGIYRPFSTPARFCYTIISFLSQVSPQLNTGNVGCDQSQGYPICVEARAAHAKLAQRLSRSAAVADEPERDRICIDIAEWADIVSIVGKFQHTTTAGRDRELNGMSLQPCCERAHSCSALTSSVRASLGLRWVRRPSAVPRQSADLRRAPGNFCRVMISPSASCAGWSPTARTRLII